MTITYGKIINCSLGTFDHDKVVLFIDYIYIVNQKKMQNIIEFWDQEIIQFIKKFNIYELNTLKNKLIIIHDDEIVAIIDVEKVITEEQLLNI